MAKRHHSFVVIAIILTVIIGYAMYWRSHTVEKFELTEQYLILNYVSGKTKLIKYDEIEDIKFFKTSRHLDRDCGLHFYLTNNKSIKTRENIACSEINHLRNEILHKANRPIYDIWKKILSASQ